MQCTRGSLKRPLRDIIKSIGHAADSAPYTHLRCLDLPRSHHGFIGHRTTATAITGHNRRSCAHDGIRHAVNHGVRSYATAEDERQTAESDTVAGNTLKVAEAVSQPSDYTPQAGTSTSATGRQKPLSGGGNSTVEPRPRSGRDFSPRYFKTQLSKHTADLSKAAKRIGRHHRSGPDAWKRVLRMLDQATAAREELYKRISEIVKLPEGVAAVFRPNKAVAILEIMQRTGCHVQMRSGLSVEGRQEAFTGLVLQGTLSENSAALKVLPSYIEVSVIQTAQTRSQLKVPGIHRQTQLGSASESETEDDLTVREHANDGNDDDSSGQLAHAWDRQIHSVWSTGREKRDLQLRQQYHDHSQIKTILDFTAYVEDLTAVEKLSTRDQNEGEPSHRVTSVATELVSLFTNPTTLHFSTDLSTSHAFQYLAKYERIDAVRQISQALVEAGHTLGPRSFDAMLAAASHKGDLHNFELVLRTMRRHHIPSPRAWAQFHALVLQLVPHEANTIVALMRSKGLLQANEALHIISRDTIRRDFIAYIQEKGAFPGFTQMYTEKVARDFGRPDFNWLTVDALRRMLGVLLSLGRTDEAVTLMEEFRKRGTKPPDTASLNIFLTSNMNNSDAPSAIATLKMFHVGRPGALVPDDYTYSILFTMAWRKKHYNMLRVIWRYACVAGQVSGKLRHRILTSLLHDSPAEENDMNGSKMFKAWAGKFVVGVSRDLVPASYVPY
ncbi:hypothetical protein CERZMDRAFT_51531, partial [Cercospora zeae-maydis SCOH1-5]